TLHGLFVELGGVLEPDVLLGADGVVADLRRGGALQRAARAAGQVLAPVGDLRERTAVDVLEQQAALLRVRLKVLAPGLARREPVELVAALPAVLEELLVAAQRLLVLGLLRPGLRRHTRVTFPTWSWLGPSRARRRVF